MVRGGGGGVRGLEEDGRRKEVEAWSVGGVWAWREMCVCGGREGTRGGLFRDLSLFVGNVPVVQSCTFISSTSPKEKTHTTVVF